MLNDKICVVTGASSNIGKNVAIRLSKIVKHIYLVGRTKDAQELFEYHGAEHMTIASFEDKQSLDFEDVIQYPKEHIRCGTSFLFLIVFISRQLQFF